jgi:hypothetical protein
MTRSSRPWLSIVAAVGVLGIGAVACSARIADLTLVSTRNLDLSNTKLDAKTGKRVKGEDCKYAILGLIPLGVPNLESAVDDALTKGGGNVMVDQVTSQRGIYFVLASQMCILVEGTVIKTAGES